MPDQENAKSSCATTSFFSTGTGKEKPTFQPKKCLHRELEHPTTQPIEKLEVSATGNNLTLLTSNCEDN